MNWKIGLPRALFYHTYFPLWTTFFEALGGQVIVSPPTNKIILDEGIQSVVAETCLPVKIFFGHVQALCQKNLDYLFVPRLISVEKKAYICPKFMGLPDMLEASKIKHPPLIKPVINQVKTNQVNSFLCDCAAPFTTKWSKIKKAWQKAMQEQRDYEQKLVKEIKTTDLNILILGHDYNLHDHYLNLGLWEKLRRLGCTIILPSHFPQRERETYLQKFPKLVFWTYGKTQLGAVYSFMEQPGLKGVINLTSFGCGIDSFMDSLIIRRLIERQIPYLNVILDEHSGKAGLFTRLEAFVDIIRWRSDNHQDYISSYGYNVGTCQRDAGTSGSRGDCAAPLY